MIQMNVLFSEPDKNIQRASELVKSAKAKGAQICVLPECMDLGWGNPDANSLAEPVPGKVRLFSTIVSIIICNCPCQEKVQNLLYFSER